MPVVSFPSIGGLESGLAVFWRGFPCTYKSQGFKSNEWLLER